MVFSDPSGGSGKDLIIGESGHSIVGGAQFILMKAAQWCTKSKKFDFLSVNLPEASTYLWFPGVLGSQGSPQHGNKLFYYDFIHM